MAQFVDISQKPLGNRQEKQRNDEITSVSVVRPNSNEKDKREHPQLPPTLEAGAELQFAYSYFNEELFGGRLPDCVITYTRKKNVLGHFCADRFQRVGGALWPELALNPTYLALREDRESLSTLVHEQAHVARHYFGPLNKRGGHGSAGYHDIPWADIMDRVGLTPSDTGMPGGKRTGHRMTHYIVQGGPFDLTCKRLLDQGFRIHWRDRLFFAGGAGVGGSLDPSDPASPSKKNDRVKFTCSLCLLNAWAKPSARLTCTDCNHPMHSPDTSSTAMIPQ